MAKRGHKTHELGFDFIYSGQEDDKGQFITASAIDLQAPSFKFLHFQSTVEAKIAGAMFSMMGDMKNIKELMEEVDEEEAREKAKEAGGSGTLEMLSGAMDDKDYADFIIYIIRFLTNTDMAKIANTNIKMTDELWERVADEGGNEAIKEVVADFLDFFDTMGRNKTSKNTPLPKSNGPVSYMTPVLPTEVR